MNTLLDFIYPPTCIACGKYGRWVCDTCHQRALQPRFESEHAWVGSYKEPAMRLLIGNLKYHAAICLKLEIESLLDDAKSSLEPWLKTSIDWIVPVPGDEERIRSRGIDHACEIASSIQNVYFPNAKLKSVLGRTKQALANAQLPHEARQANLESVFVCNEALEGNILLVDDVYTTGATTNACRQTLLTTGAAHVLVLTLSRALGESR